MCACWACSVCSPQHPGLAAAGPLTLADMQEDHVASPLQQMAWPASVPPWVRLPKCFLLASRACWAAHKLSQHAASRCTQPIHGPCNPDEHRALGAGCYNFSDNMLPASFTRDTPGEPCLCARSLPSRACEAGCVAMQPPASAAE